VPKQRPTDALTRLGKRIRARRYYLQLPLHHLAHEVELSNNMLCEYESGRAHPPCFTLLRIAKALGTTTADLLVERRKGNSDDVNFAVYLFADPSINAVAALMQRLSTRERKQMLRVVQAALP